jgi:serine/threonine protein kinase
VLELCAGGGLDKRLACLPGSSRPPLPWQERVRIAAGVARSLVYLHSQSPPLLHRDVKSANVLLDEKDEAKVADFGTIFEAHRGTMGGKTHHVTRTVVGTRGYMPPEYTKTGEISERTDAYAFGIVLLELLTGLPPEDAINLHADHADRLFAPGKLALHADMRAGAWPSAAVRGLGQVAKQLLQHAKRRRALVAQVLPELEALRSLLAGGAPGDAGGASGGGGDGAGCASSLMCCLPAHGRAVQARRTQAQAKEQCTVSRAAQRQLQSLVESPDFNCDFDEFTGAPVNTDARRMCVYQVGRWAEDPPPPRLYQRS